ncbi:MAG: flippase [Chlorobaculum sp.]
MNESKSRLRHDIVALGLVQMANYAIPLITIPYLTRVLGVHAFGQVAFAQALRAYFIVIIEFGFTLSATREIASRRNDRAHVSRTFINTWFAQLGLLFFTALLAFIMVNAVSRLRVDGALYASAFIGVFGTTLFPIWLLQGLERLRDGAFIQVGSRLLGVIPLFLMVHGPQDAVLVLVIQGLSILLGGVFSLLWIKQQELVDWMMPNWYEITSAYKEGYQIFSSRVSISLYTAAVPIVLGWVSGPSAMGYFTLADKLRSAAQAMTSPVTQALYPRMSYLFKNEPGEAKKLLKRSAVLVVVIAGLMSLGLFIFSDLIIYYVAGKGYGPAAQVLRWLAFVPFAVALSNLLGVQIMLPLHMNKRFNMILVSASGICLLVVWFLVSKNHEIGAAQTILLVESYVVFMMFLYLKKKYFISH